MFVPAAVSIIEEEEQAKNPQTPSTDRTSLKEKYERRGHNPT
jgi:hypothetical protein